MLPRRRSKPVMRDARFMLLGCLPCRRTCFVSASFADEELIAGRVATPTNVADPRSQQYTDSGVASFAAPVVFGCLWVRWLRDSQLDLGLRSDGYNLFVESPSCTENVFVRIDGDLSQKPMAQTAVPAVGRFCRASTATPIPASHTGARAHAHASKAGPDATIFLPVISCLSNGRNVPPRPSCPGLSWAASGR